MDKITSTVLQLTSNSCFARNKVVCVCVCVSMTKKCVILRLCFACPDRH